MTPTLRVWTTTCSRPGPGAVAGVDRVRVDDLAVEEPLDPRPEPRALVVGAGAAETELELDRRALAGPRRGRSRVGVAHRQQHVGAAAAQRRAEELGRVADRAAVR